MTSNLTKMTFPLLQTKLFIPTDRHLLPRPHLINLLEEGRKAGHRLILVSSSAGSGKTSLLSEWAARHPEEFCWLSLDSEDNEPVRFWKYLIAALQRVQPGVGQNAASMLESSQPVPSQTILIGLINDIVNDPKPFILVLDDYHILSSQEIHSGIAFLLEHLPHGVSLVISTRADPPLPIVRLRAHNSLTEIREAHLRFSAEEASLFLKTMGLSLSIEDVLAIDARTEGWIAGLQLVGLALKSHSITQDQTSADPHHFISAFTGSHQHILDYLAEEVLSHLDPSVQDFLMKTSILERLCAELCEEVMQGAGDHKDSSSVAPVSGRSILTFLEHANLFTIPLDEEHRWFRFHHLFADLLSSRLQDILSAGEIQELHIRASHWLAQNGWFDEAIRHALLSQNFEMAAGLIEPLARTMMFSGRVNTLKHWIDSLPDACLQSHLHLKIYAVWIVLMQGICELTQQKIQETEQLIQALPPLPENNQLKVELMVVLCRFIAISGDTSQAIRVALEALELIGENDLASRARVQSALAIAYGLDGSLEKADRAFKECLQLARTSGYYSLAAHTTMLVGLGNTHYGRLREPARYLQEVINLGTSPGQTLPFPVGQGYIGLAGIYLEWNRLDEAEELLQKGIELCRQGGLDGAFSRTVLQARLRQARGDLSGALEEIQIAEKVFERKDHDTADRQVQILLAMGNTDAASRWLPPLTSMLNADPAASRIPFLFLEVLQILVARILLARGEITQALQMLDEIQARAVHGKRFGHLIEVYALKALAFEKQNGGKMTPQALEYLELALQLAGPEGYTLLFLEMGAELVPLLEALTHHATAANGERKYAGELLTAFSARSIPGEVPAAMLAAPLEDNNELSQREIEILGLIGEGQSNQDIADHLFITLHTVKKHTSHIFSKLGVTSRTQAVARARQAGLLQ